MPMNPSFRLEWWREGYGLDMGSSEVCRPPSRSSGYIRVYHLTTEPAFQAIIEQRRFKLSRFSTLNDPFELLPLSIEKINTRELSKRLKQKFGEANGLVCFSGNWVNPVLWSHYAESHRGVCLGFDLMKSKSLRVNYQERRIQDKFWSQRELENPSPELWRLLLSTKFLHWQYEQEIRLVLPHSETHLVHNERYYNFGEDIVLREVILGANCALEWVQVKESVNRTYGDKGISVIKARPADKFFSIVPDENTV